MGKLNMKGSRKGTRTPKKPAPKKAAPKKED